MKEMLSNNSILKLSRQETVDEMISFIKSIRSEDLIPEGFYDIDEGYQDYLDECEEYDLPPMSYSEFAETKLEHYMEDCDARHYIEFLLKRLIIDFDIDTDALLIELNKQNISAYNTSEYTVVINTLKGSVVVLV